MDQPTNQPNIKKFCQIISTITTCSGSTLTRSDGACWGPPTCGSNGSKHEFKRKVSL